MAEKTTQEEIKLSGNDFIPGADFTDQFANTPIGEDEDEHQEDNHSTDNNDDNQETPEQKEEKFKAANGGKTESEVAAAKQKVIDDQVAADKVEEEKVSKMTPEEKEKYLEEKNKSTTGDEKPKPFEEELVTRFNGKYKTVAEIEAALNAPPKEQEFADETVRNLNEYVKNGGKIDADYLREITTDYNAINDGVELAMRHLAATDPSFKNADAEELEYEVRKRYDMNNWSEDGDEVNDVRRVMEKKLQREAPEFRNALKEKQDKLQFIKPADPKIAEQAAEERKANLKEWVEKVVPNIVKEVSKLSTPLSDKEAFDYTNDANDMNEVVQVMNSMGENAKVFWGQFFDKEGKFDNKKVLTMMLRDRGYDKAVKLASAQGRAAGREEEIKNIKGINFDKDKQRNEGAASQSFDQAVYESVSKNM